MNRKTLKRLMCGVFSSSVLATSFLLGNGTVAAQSVGVQPQCGQQINSTPLKGNVWLASTSSNKWYLTSSSVGVSSQVGQELPGLSNDTIPTDMQLSRDGNSLAFLSKDNHTQPYDPTGLIALNVVTHKGENLTFPAAKNWWELGPELQPGHFGVLAYDEGYNAQIVDVSWVNGKFQTQIVETLPLKVRMVASVWEKRVFISPNWDYLAYMTPNDFNIYSVKEKRDIWTQHNLSGIPGLIWSVNKDYVAVVNMGGTDGNGVLITVDPHGNSQPISDLSAVFAKDIRVTNYAPTMTADNHLAIETQSHLTAGTGQIEIHLLIIDVKSLHITDLCVSTQTGLLAWSEGGQYVIFSDAADQSKLTVMSTKTGDYSLIPFNDQSVAYVITDSANSKP